MNIVEMRPRKLVLQKHSPLLLLHFGLLKGTGKTACYISHWNTYFILNVYLSSKKYFTWFFFFFFSIENILSCFVDSRLSFIHTFMYHWLQFLHLLVLSLAASSAGKKSSTRAILSANFARNKICRVNSGTHFNSFPCATFNITKSSVLFLFLEIHLQYQGNISCTSSLL